MDKILHEEAFGVPLHGKLFICVKVETLFEPHISESCEVHGDGCEKVGFHLKGQL